MGTEITCQKVYVTCPNIPLRLVGLTPGLHCKELPVCPDGSDSRRNQDGIIGIDCRELPPCPDGSDWIPGIECKELPPCERPVFGEESELRQLRNKIAPLET